MLLLFICDQRYQETILDTHKYQTCTCDRWTFTWKYYFLNDVRSTRVPLCCDWLHDCCNLVRVQRLELHFPHCPFKLIECWYMLMRRLHFFFSWVMKMFDTHNVECFWVVILFVIYVWLHCPASFSLYEIVYYKSWGCWFEKHCIFVLARHTFSQNICIS